MEQVFVKAGFYSCFCLLQGNPYVIEEAGRSKLKKQGGPVVQGWRTHSLLWIRISLPHNK